MSKKDDLGPMGNYIRSVNEARAFGTSSDPWATARVRVERQLEKDRLKASQTSAWRKPPASSSKNNDTDSKVICTELVRQGLFDRSDYVSGARYVEAHLTERHVRGYHAWGVPVVRRMRRSRRATAFWRRLAQARADHIAFLGGDASRRNRFGAFLCAVGHPACYLIGGLVGEQDWRSLYDEGSSLTAR